ncbi:MAG: pyridoxamine 5'-phosphate oxidase family protein [Pseudomonadota bacterium]
MTSNYDQFLDCLESFDNAMLVTSRDDMLRARPMAIADKSDEGRLWFFSRADSGKLDEIRADSSAAVCMQGSNRFLSVSGTVTVHRDRQKIDDLWHDIQHVWFPDGKDDPNLRLLEFSPRYAEFWDTAGLNGLKFAFEAVRGVLEGRRPDVPDEAHGKVVLSE